MLSESEAYSLQTENPTVKHLLAQYAIHAYMELGNMDLAEKKAEEYNFYNQAKGVCILAEINWQRGAKQSAVWLLKSALGRLPEKIPLLNQLAKYELEMENYNEARKYLQMLMQLRPKKWIPHGRLHRSPRQIRAFRKSGRRNTSL